MPSFGKKSKERLEYLCTEMAYVAHDAIEIIDFSVIETARSKRTQNRYFAKGTSHLQWPKSKHNVYIKRPKAEAMDLWPYIPPYGALSGHPTQITKIVEQTGRSRSEVKEFVYKAFAQLAGVIITCGHYNGIQITWGGDWDGDFNLIDQKFHDLPHHEWKK